MANPLILAVDLGTSFIKAGIYDGESRCVVGASRPVREERLKPGVYIQRAGLIFAVVLECVRDVVEKLGEAGAGQIEAMVFTGQMAGFMGVGENWEDITSWSCSLDNRYLPAAAGMLRRHGDDILRIAGTNSPVMAPKIKWFGEAFPQEAKAIRKYIMISGYVLGRLGNLPIGEAVIDRTYLEWTGLSDIISGAWSPQLLEALSISRDQLPEIVESTRVCGRLSPEMAGELGLKGGIPLVSGAGDKPAGCLGAAVVKPGDTILEAASYGGMSCCVEEYRPDFGNRRLDVIPAAIPGLFYSHYYIAGSGVTLDWFVDNFPGNREPGSRHREMDALAAQVPPGAEGLMSIGMLGGCAMPLDSGMRGLWSGFSWSHRPEHFYRSLLECYGYEFTMTTNTYDALYPEHAGAPVRIIGGGSKSALWTQIHADISGRTYQTLNRADVALWGACIIAGKAIGLYADMKETARKYVSVTAACHTNEENHRFYTKKLADYQELLRQSQGIFPLSGQ